MAINENREYRMRGTFQLEENENKELKLTGVPIVFEDPTLIYEQDGVQFYEVIARGALDSADMSDFVFNVNHEGRVYARSKNGTAQLHISDTNASADITLRADDEGHRELYADIQSGILDKMSFAFTVEEDAYNVETHTRTITRIKKLYDISAVDRPAYENTSISARSAEYFAEEYRKELDAERQKADAEKRAELRTICERIMAI